MIWRRNGLWLSISNAQAATGLTYGWFRRTVLPKLKTKSIPGKKKPEYFLTEEFLSSDYKKNHKDELIELDDEDISDENMINDILGDIAGNNNGLPIDPENVDLNEARRQEIIMRTKYLSQKIEKKKLELFEEWSEKFFTIFSKNFAKFKNTLIDLHLEEKQLKKLTENLNFALENMEEGLNEILQEHMDEMNEVEGLEKWRKRLYIII